MTLQVFNTPRYLGRLIMPSEDAVPGGRVWCPMPCRPPWNDTWSCDADGKDRCCVCNRVRRTSCGYVAVVAQTLLSTVAAMMPNQCTSSDLSPIWPISKPVNFIFRYSYSGNWIATWVRPRRAGESPE